VPQAPAQKTAATQPYPRGDAFVDQSVSPQAFRSFAATLPKGTRLVNGGRIFTPYSPGGTALTTPSDLGGDDWFPMSTHYLYVCGPSITSERGHHSWPRSPRLVRRA
jgi:quinohemoprotein ethanol dehydrogenase